MKILFTFLSFVVASLPLYAQPVLEWQNSYGGSEYDIPRAIHSTPDGGLVVAAITYSNDGDAAGNRGINDLLVIKLKADKSVQWKRLLGGSLEDGAHDIQPTSDGGYIVAGYTRSKDGDVTGVKGATDFWVIKLDATGDILWQRTYGGTQQEVASSIRELPGGGYIVAGYTMSGDGDVTNNHEVYKQDAWIIRLDNLGNLLWQQCYGGTGSDFAYHISLTANGYIFSGYTTSNDGDVVGHKNLQDAWIVKLTTTGVIEWQRTLGGSSNEAAQQVKPVPGGGYIVVGGTSSADGDIHGNKGLRDALLVRLDEDGDVLWSRCLGGSSLEEARSVNITSSGNFIITCSAESMDHDVAKLHGKADYWIVQVNTNGQLVWQQNLGGSEIDDANTACITPQGKLLVAGTSFSKDHDVSVGKEGGDIWIVQLGIGLPRPVITRQPADTTVCQGATAVFTIAAQDAITYQWQLLENNNWTNITDNNIFNGAATPTLTVVSTTGLPESSFRCRVVNGQEEVVSRAAKLFFRHPPVFTLQPFNKESCTGTANSLGVLANNAGTYQWQYSSNNTVWTNLPGASGNSATIHLKPGRHYYRCQATNECGIVNSNVAVVSGRNCHIPNAFSPNGDGINDTWVISAQGNTKTSITVFDRYGSRVFESNGHYPSWNGTFKGRPLPTAVYYYVIDPGDGSPLLSGSVTIAR